MLSIEDQWVAMFQIILGRPDLLLLLAALSVLVPLLAWGFLKLRGW